jgi:SAM-dependent methyltransferase
MPSSEEQATFYPKNYYSYEYKKNILKNRLNLMDLWKSFFDILFRLFEKKWFNIQDYKEWYWKHFLDVGCWDGIHLDIMEKKWWKSFWFEIGKQEKKGNIYYGNNIKDINRWTKFDLIYMIHVFEHVDTPEETLKTLKILLKDNGRLIITLPSSDWLFPYLHGKYSPERDIPRHLFTYNKKNLSLFFKNSWFKIESSCNLRQNSFFSWLCRRIKDKYNFDLAESKLKYLFLPILFIELFLTMINYIKITKHTNQIWFILKK